MATSYKRWMNQLVANLIEHMNLAGWNIELDFSDIPHADDRQSRGVTLANINVLSQYQDGKIQFFPASKDYFDKNQTDKLVATVVHELSHVFTAPFADFIEPHLSGVTGPFFTDILESQTQKITMLILKTLPKSVIPPRSNGIVHNPTPKKHKLRPANDQVVSADLYSEHGK